jgi:hypothetical protein
MSGYLTRLLAGAVQPQRAVRPLLGALFGRPSAGPEWLLRDSRQSRARAAGGGVDADPEMAHMVEDGALREDSPAVTPAPSPPRFAAATSTPADAVDPALRDPRRPARTLRGDGRSSDHTSRDAAHAPSTGEAAFRQPPELGHASSEERQLERLRPRAHERERGQQHLREREHAAAPRDAARENAAPGDGRSTEILWVDPLAAEPDPGADGRSARRPAALAPTAAPGRIARLPLQRDSAIEPIRRYTSQPQDESPRDAMKDHHTHSARAAEAMAAAVRPAVPAQSPAGRDSGHLAAAARRPSLSVSERAQRPGAENRYGAEPRRADPEPTVHVTIGTVEIKAAVRSNPPRPRPASPAAPRVGLDEYLRRRRTGDPS